MYANIVSTKRFAVGGIKLSRQVGDTISQLSNHLWNFIVYAAVTSINVFDAR